MNSFLEQPNINLDNLISYFNGLLSALEILNDGQYTGNTFYFAKVENLSNDFEKSIINHLNLKGWKADLSIVEDFYLDIDNALNDYCQAYTFEVKEVMKHYARFQIDEPTRLKILENTHFKDLKHNVFTVMRMILQENYAAYSVRVLGSGWYEASYKDYFFNCNGTYFYLHFGVSD